MKQHKRFILLFTLLIVLMCDNVYAYLDPGTGSYMLQILIAAALGGVYALKVYWAKILYFFRNIFKAKDRDKKDS
jgi:hypothetical protein